MGIPGLLPIIKPILVKRHISSYAGKKIGIDGHAWLYQIVPSIAQELFFGLPTTRHVHILTRKIRSLKSNGIDDIVFVFDGESLKSKTKTLLERSRKKEAARNETMRLLRANNVTKAREMMQRCVQITSEVMMGVIELLKKEGIEFVISPYESDAQLTYLQRIGHIDYILTEDSDLILYGSTNILYKYDLSHVHEYQRERLAGAWNSFFAENIVDICILSGCDYLDGLDGVGIKTACKLLEKHSSVEKVVEAWRARAGVPENFLEEFERAKMTFKHQVVFDPINKKRVFLSDIPDKGTRPDFLGSFIEDEERFSRGHHLLRKDTMDFFVAETKRTKKATEHPAETKRSANARTARIEGDIVLTALAERPGQRLANGQHIAKLQSGRASQNQSIVSSCSDRDNCYSSSSSVKL
ncbi:UNVERIFIED_CONTAM: hypothetical protein PYX00_011318 [Menopon gallinae]|uniref:Exonuclease 1 n=1 Tax=Menopon gallinae TaxID=328185 RepID=A0AAW2H7A9_9NEOP